MTQTHISPIQDIIEEAKNGKMFIIIDDEDRENEGDLVIPAQMATPEIINFMVMNARGLICLALNKKRCDELGLELMPSINAPRYGTPFTLSIEAKQGVTTGVSAKDRAHTIATAIHPEKTAQDIVSPGHIFPLRANKGGVLVRAGHTEGATDITRLAGLNPSAVICEVMNDDGSMARLPDLIAFSQKHDIKIGKISDLIAYRSRYDPIVVHKSTTQIQSAHAGAFDLNIYVNKVEYAEHVALIKGDIDQIKEPIPVRVQTLDFMKDILGDQTNGQPGELFDAMKLIEKIGYGVIVLIREPSPTSLSEQVAEHQQASQSNAKESVKQDDYPLRNYGVGAYILKDLGIQDMTLLTNNEKNIIALEGFGLNITGYHPLK